MRSIRIGLSFWAVVVAWSAPSALAQPGSLDTTFVPPRLPFGVFEPVVSGLAVQPNGRVVFSRRFNDNSFYGTVVARLNSNGSADTGFVSSRLTNELVFALTVDGSSRTIIAGSFTSVQGQPRNRVARLNPDGSLDMNFDIGVGADAEVIALAVQSDGRILVGGKFTNVGGTTRKGIARLNTDGSLDTSFDPGTGVDNPGSNEVRSLVALSDGRVLMGGSFTTFNGTNRNRIARVNANGSLDPGFDPGTGANNTINDIAVQPDGKIMVGGAFDTMDGATRMRIARLQSNGSLDETFNPLPGTSGSRQPPDFPPDDQVEAIALQPDGRVLIGGRFYYVNGVFRDSLARLHVDGSLDYDFDIELGPFGYEGVQELVVQADGKLLVGGSFSYFQNLVSPQWFEGILRLNTANSNFPGRFEFSSARYLVREAAGPVPITVRRSAGAVGAASVSYYTRDWDGSAGTPGDYIGTNGTVHFNAGETSKVFTVRIVNDTLGEDGHFFATSYRHEIFSISLLGTTGGAVLGSQDVAYVDIEDDDTSFTFTSPSFSVDELGGRATVQVRRLGRTEQTHAVTCTMGGGTALGGVDYVTRSDTLTFAPGETRKDFYIQILEDELTEGNETVIVTLSAPTGGATLIAPTATLTIEDRPGTVISTWPGAVDTTFFPGWWQDGAVRSLSVADDGRIFASGSFYRTGGERRYLAWLHPNGTLDESFNPPPSLTGWAVAAQPDGRVLVATGTFGSGTVLRLTANGSEDLTFGPTTYQGGDVWVIARQTDGRLIIAGNFTNMNNVARQWIARLTENGSLDASFDAGIGPGEGFNPGATLYAVAIQPDGKVIVGGDFRTFNGFVRPGLVRLSPDGNVDPSFDASTAVNTTIYRIVLQSDGKVIVAAYGLTLNGRPVGIIRLNSDGTRDSTFDPGLGTEGNAITAVAVQTDGKVLVGGAFTTFNGVPRKHIARLHGDGSLDITFDGGAGASPDYSVETIALEADGGVLIGGDFNRFNGRLRNGIARLIGGDPPTTPPLIISQPPSQTVLEGADVIFRVVARAFPLPTFHWTFNGQPISGATRSNLNLINVDATHAGAYAVIISNSLGVVTSSNATLAVVPAPTQPGAVDLSFRVAASLTERQGRRYVGVTTFAVQGDGKIVVLAAYAQSHQIDLQRVARLNSDGSLDPGFKPDVEISGGAQSLALQPDGKILIGGWFFQVGEERTANIARLNADGTLDTSFVPGGYASYYINGMAIQADGRIVIVGQFNHFADVPRRGIARLYGDGTLDSSFDPGTGVGDGFQPYVASVGLQSDGKILIGGAFSTVAGQPRQNIVRLNVDGSLDANFNPATEGQVRAITLQPDGKSVVGGYFSAVDGVPRSRLARLDADGNLDNGFVPTLGPNDSVQALASGNHRRLIVAGTFTNVPYVPRPWFGRFLPDGRLDTSFNAGGGPDDMVYDLALQSDGAVLIAGSFTNVDQRPRFGIARLFSEPAAAAGALEFTSTRLWTPENGGVDVLLHVRRIGGAHGLVTVNYAVSGGNATGGVDFLLNAGVLTFGDGDANEQTIRVTVFDDETAEGDETIAVWLANPLGGATLGVEAAAEISILDDDTAVQLAASEFAVNEGTGSLALEIQRLGHTNGSVTVHLATSNGTAQAGFDYIGQDCIVTFIPGQTNQTVLLVLLDDRVAENDETLQVALTAPGGALLGSNAVANIRIRDNDRPGTLDTSFDPDPDVWLTIGFFGGGVNAILVQPDGRILLAGRFHEPVGGLTFGVARIWQNGMLDSSFYPGGWSDGWRIVHDASVIALQPDGKVLVVPDYEYAGRLIRLFDYGFLDEDFSIPVANGPINSVLVQPDGRILIGGEFTAVHEMPRNGLARLNADGSLDVSFVPVTDLQLRIKAIALHADGSISVSGHFWDPDDAPTLGPVRFSPTGTLDTNFQPRLQIDWGSGHVMALLLQPDGRLLVTGDFSHVNGLPRAGLARLLADGAVDESFNANHLTSPVDEFGPYAQLRAVALQPDGRILVGGYLRTSFERHRSLVRLKSDGSLDVDFAPNFNDSQTDPGEVRALAVQRDGQILAGGEFAILDGLVRLGLARLNGGVWRFEFRSVKRLLTGNVRLMFAEPRGQPHLLQASSNLVHWIDLNGGRPLRDLSEFTEMQVPGADKRFYRAVQPQ